MSRNRQHRQNPAEEFLEIQEHRYDPGYWTLKVKNGGTYPMERWIRQVRFSPFSRTLAVFVLLGPLVFGIFSRYRESLQHPWLYCATALVLVFLGLWFWMRRSLKKYGLGDDNGTENLKRRVY